MVDRADSEDFGRLAGPFRRELLAHCYRMLGSLHDAEDLVQETFLRAWRAYAEYDSSRASLRTWLYRIATNACLTALQSRTRRPLPSGFVGPSDGPERPMGRHDEVPWLQPMPDALLGPGPDDPAAIVAQRGSVRLAFIAALQHLPPKQRAVLLLRDVLALRAAEVADLLGTSVASVNSSLQRARAQLAEVSPAETDLAEPADTKQRELLDAYMAAFVAADVGTLSRLLAQDVVLEMPPWLNWFSGREATRDFIASKILAVPDRWRMVPTSANGQPAAAAYRRPDGGGDHQAHAVHVFTITGAGVAHIVAFQDPALFAAFGLPLTYLGAAAQTPAASR